MMTALIVIGAIWVIGCACLVVPVMDGSSDLMEAVTKVLLWPYFLLLGMAVNVYRITKDYLK